MPAPDTNQTDTEAFDVAIIGGGLAGLSLAIQLKRTRPASTVVVLEKRSWPVPEAAHKVGESLLQIGAHYFHNTCGMAAHLASEQLPKMGLRFFLPSGSDPIDQRVEIGLAGWVDNAPTYQLDRGRFENALAQEAQRLGVSLRAGTSLLSVEQITQADSPRRFTLTHRAGDSPRSQLLASRVVDASGRAAVLKRKFGLSADVSHHCNAAWFRLGRRLKVDDWCDTAAWQERVPTSTRWQSTNHFMGPGYWFWVIPLASDSTSFGLVADPDLVPFEEMNRFETLLAWLQEHEPAAAEIVRANSDARQDFRTLKHYAHSCQQVFSTDGWYITGEAGVFLDPLFSPGSDAIAISNTMITRLITASLDGEDVDQPTELFNGIYLLMCNRLFSIWDHQYPLFGCPEVAATKIAWDFLGYFSSLALLGVTGRIADPEFLLSALPYVNRISELNHNMQQHLHDWNERAPSAEPAGYPCMSEQTYTELERTIATSPTRDAAWVREQIAANAARVEAAAIEIIVRSAAALGIEVDPQHLDPCTYRLPGAQRDEAPVTTEAPQRVSDSGLNWATADQPTDATSASYSVWLPSPPGVEAEPASAAGSAAAA